MLVDAARRVRIEHPRAAHRRLPAQDDPVAARGRERLREAELRQPAVGANEPPGHRGGAVADGEAAVALDPLGRVEHHVEPVRGNDRAGRHDRVARLGAALALGRHGEGHPLAGRRPLDLVAVHLDAPHPHLVVVRQHLEPVAGRNASRPEGSRDDPSGAGQAERPVDVQPGATLMAAEVDRRGRASERGDELLEPRPLDRAHPHHLMPREQTPDSRLRGLHARAVDGVHLRQRDDALLDPEQAQDLQVLVGLRLRPLPRVDDEQEEVDPRRARDHRPDEPLVPRHVDDREARPVRKLELRVAECDRDPAPLLLGQPVGVGARQRLDEAGLAVVDVPGRPQREPTGGRHEARQLSTAAATAATSSSAIVRQSRSVRPSRTRATTGVGAARSVADRSPSSAQAALGSSSSGSAPPPTRATVSTTSPPAAAASRSARALIDVDVLVQHPQHRDLALRPLRIEIEKQCPLERREGQLVRTQRPLQRMTPQPTDQLRPAADDPGLRPTEQLVAGEGDEVGAAGDALRHERLVRERSQAARAEIVEQRQPVAPRERDQLLQLRPLREPDRPEVRLVHPEEQRRPLPHRRLVVGGPRAVRRPDLDQARA